MSLRRGRGMASQHAELSRVKATFRKKVARQREWDGEKISVWVSAGFPGGVNWLLCTKMVTCCLTTTRRNDYSSTQQALKLLFLRLFLLLISRFHFCIDLHLHLSNLCSAKDKLTLIPANECWIWENEILGVMKQPFSGENLQCKWCG